MVIIVFIPFGCLAFLLSFAGLRKPMRVFTYKIAQIWALMIVACSGCDIIIEGKENIPKKGGICFTANHGGMFDIVLALAYIGRPFGFIAKKELGFIPLLNLWIYILGGLFIDRRNPRAALKTIGEGVRRLKAGDCMLIFPEGTRSRNEGILPFKSGSFKLATQAESLIIPMAITGSYNVFEKEGKVVSSAVRVKFLTPVDTATVPFAERKQILADRIHDAIEAAVGES
jgi:1-acyl-sn-glycerol-3-phosphate acyltransferase